MNTLEKINPIEFGLKKSEAQNIEAAFMPKIVERDGIKPIYEALLTKEITPQLCKEARQTRLQLVKIRTGIAEIHKTQKAFFLAAGRFVDAWKNKETTPIIQMEDNLAAIEEYYEKIEAEKIKKLQEERAIEMAKFEAEFIPGNLGELTYQVWDNFIYGTKHAYELKKAAEKLVKEQEEARVAAEKAEQERIRVENEALKVKIESERKAAEEKFKAEQEIARKAAEKAAAEKAALEAELKAKAESERKAAEEKEAILQAELSKGDSAKVLDLIADLEKLKTKYIFKSEKNNKMYSDVAILLDTIISHIK